MSAAGKLISTRADFPNVQVYEQEKGGRTIYRIAFKNAEWESGFAMVLCGAIALGLFGVTFIGPFVYPKYAGNLFVGGLIGVMFYYFLFRLPWKIDRMIELDMGMDRLRSLRKNKVVAERQLSRLVDLSVGEHPAAQEARARRQQNNEKALRPEEKQHCLYGWFGAGGAERVMLVERYEWPVQNSLYEVRQAILWTIKQAAGVPAANPFRPAADEEPRQARGPVPQTLNPPLD